MTEDLTLKEILQHPAVRGLSAGAASTIVAIAISAIAPALEQLRSPATVASLLVTGMAAGVVAERKQQSSAAIEALRSLPTASSTPDLLQSIKAAAAGLEGEELVNFIKAASKLLKSDSSDVVVREARNRRVNEELQQVVSQQPPQPPQLPATAAPVLNQPALTVQPAPQPAQPAPTQRRAVNWNTVPNNVVRLPSAEPSPPPVQQEEEIDEWAQ